MDERHPTDAVSLLFGVVFTLLGAAFLLEEVPAVPVIDLRWIGPLVVLLIGLWMLVSTALPSRRGDRDEREDAGATAELEES